MNKAGVKLVSRVSQTSTEAKTVIHEGSEEWKHSEDGTMHWFSLPPWLEVQSEVGTHARHEGKGPPRKGASPATLSHDELVTASQEQGGLSAASACYFFRGTNTRQVLPVPLGGAHLRF